MVLPVPEILFMTLRLSELSLNIHLKSHFFGEYFPNISPQNQIMPPLHNPTTLFMILITYICHWCIDEVLLDCEIYERKSHVYFTYSYIGDVLVSICRLFE